MIRRSSWLVLVALAIAGIVSIWVNVYLNEPLRLTGDAYRLDVTKGASLTSVARDLADDDVLRLPQVFALLGRLTGKAERIQAGEYELAPGITPKMLLTQLVDGRVILHSLTIVEGWTVVNLLAALQQHPALRQTLEIESPLELIAALELDYDHPEGLFFPETYRFPRGTTDVELLRRAHDLMEDHLSSAWADRQSDLPIADRYDALILASIVERESALETERPMVAGVFLRRLVKGMKLQTDPTVIYGLGAEFDGNLTRRHLETDNPYNTYVRKGLPPTPIALPSESALRAAVNPADGNELYFVATGKKDGSHYFTATLDEHNKAVGRYLAFLRQQKNQ
jgi:UPF0755 protein